MGLRFASEGSNMARVLSLVLLLATLSSILPPSASQAATRCEYPRHAGHGYKHPVGVRKVVVDAGGAGDFTSIQQAVDSVPVNNTVRVIVQINAGTYRYHTQLPQFFMLTGLIINKLDHGRAGRRCWCRRRSRTSRSTAPGAT
jgi:hypothetical protein